MKLIFNVDDRRNVSNMQINMIYFKIRKLN